MGEELGSLREIKGWFFDVYRTINKTIYFIITDLTKLIE